MRSLIRLSLPKVGETAFTRIELMGIGVSTVLLALGVGLFLTTQSLAEPVIFITGSGIGLFFLSVRTASVRGTRYIERERQRQRLEDQRKRINKQKQRDKPTDSSYPYWEWGRE